MDVIEEAERIITKRYERMPLINVGWSWRLLWAGRLTIQRKRTSRYVWRLEWGPPVLWKPRAARFDYADGARIYQAGWLWWLVRLGIRIREE